MFHESLATIPIKPADLIANGLPRSTAYDWCSGASTPNHSAFMLALLKAHGQTSPNKASMATEGAAKAVGKKKRKCAPSVP